MRKEFKTFPNEQINGNPVKIHIELNELNKFQVLTSNISRNFFHFFTDGQLVSGKFKNYTYIVMYSDFEANILGGSEYIIRSKVFITKDFNLKNFNDKVDEYDIYIAPYLKKALKDFFSE